MKVFISQIPEEGLNLEETQDVSKWNMDSPDIHYKGKIHLKGLFLRTVNTVKAHIKVHTTREMRCSRCLEIFTQEIDEEFDFYYSISEHPTSIEVDDDVRQEIILNFPLKTLCRKDCKGLCPVCGKNLNYGKCNCNSKYIHIFYKEEEDGST